MKKKKTYKIYLSSRSIQRGIYKNKIAAKASLEYAISFVENLLDADCVFVPREKELTDLQKEDISLASKAGKSCTVLDAELIIGKPFELKKDQPMQKAYKTKEQPVYDEDLDDGMELHI